MLMVSIVNFIVNFTYSGVFIVKFEHLNIFHILHDMKYAEIRVYTRKKVIGLIDCKLKCFPSRMYAPLSPPPNIGPSNLSFVRIYVHAFMGYYRDFTVIYNQ